MAYTFSVNNIPDTGAEAVWILIQTLVAAGWVVKADSDGTTYAATGGQVTSKGSGANGLDNASAWIRIQSPSTNGGAILNQKREFTFQRGTAISQQWRIKYSASAGFVSGAPAAAVTPSSADELFMVGGGTDAAPTFLSWFTTGRLYRWHVACGGATEGYSFYAFAMRGGSATTQNGMFLDVLSSGSYPAADVDPAVVFASAVDSYGVGGVPTGGNAGVVASGATITNSTNPCLCRAWMGATSAVGAGLVSNNQGVSLSGYTLFGNIPGVGVNPTNKKEDILPALWMRRDTSTAPNGLKGCSTLFKFGTNLMQNLSLADYASAGAKDLITIGGSYGAYSHCLLQPWNGAGVAL